MISKESYAVLFTAHKNGKTIKELSIEHNIKYKTLYYGLKRNGYVLEESKSRDRQRYQTNRDYFKIIDTEDKAYFLGFIMADGCINQTKKTPRLLFKLHQSDKYIIEEFRDLISPKRPLHKDKNNFRLEISDSILVENLIDKKVNYNKTDMGEKLPKLNEELTRHFIRGFFDGDGSISKPRIDRPNQVQVNICCSNKIFLEVLKLELTDNNIDTILTEENRKTKNMFRLVFSTHESRVKLFDYMYKNCNPKYLLNRKYIKYTEYVNTVINKGLINLCHRNA